MAYRGKEEDLFKKLNKEKPLVKQVEDKSGNITVKRMDPASRTKETKKPPELFTFQPSNPQPRSQHSFKEFSGTQGKVKTEEQQTKCKAPAEITPLSNRSVNKPAAPAYTKKPELKVPVKPTDSDVNREPAVMEAYPKKEPAKPEFTPPQRRPQTVSAPARETQVQHSSRYDIGLAHKSQERTYRHELKYYINPRDYETLKSAMSSLLLPDEHSVNGGYHIRSLYFDDYDNSALWEKTAGVKYRKKYRIRIYNKSMSFIRLERKLKNGELVSKDSLALTREEYDKIINNDIGFLLNKNSQLAHDFFIEMRTKALKPVVIVDYQREAYVYRVEDVRITFDSDLRSGLFSKDIVDQNLMTLPMFEVNLIVLEVKYNQYLPQFIKVILNNAEYTERSAVSKYLLCRKYE